MTFDSVMAYELLRVNEVVVTVGALVLGLTILALGWIGSRVMQRAARRSLLQRGERDHGNLQATLRLGHYAIMLLALIVALEVIGINLTALFAAGAVFAIGIGFALRTVAENFVAGVMLLMERSIRPGDVLEVDGRVVRVEQLGLRATLVRTRSEEEMLVPNALFVASTIKNYTLKDTLYRARTSVGVAYSSDLRLVFETLRKAANGFHPRFAGRDPIVLLTGFGSSAVDFEVSVWIDDPWQERVLLSSLNETIWWALKDASVTIAFPQHDVHLDEDVVDALRGSGARRNA